MASSIIIDWVSLHNYREDIAHAVDELKLQIRKTERAIEVVNESWKDDNFKDFQQHFDEDKEKIKPLCDVLDNYRSEILYQLEQKLKIVSEANWH